MILLKQKNKKGLNNLLKTNSKDKFSYVSISNSMFKDLEYWNN